MFRHKQILLLNLIWAIAYYLAVYLGQIFSLSPSETSLILPAASIALTALLLHGKSVLPGIILGIFVAQLSFFLDTHSSVSIFKSFFINILTTVGSTLQALLGLRLIEHYVGKNDPLIKDQKIIHFLFFAGIISSLVAPSIKTIALFLTNSQSNELITQWLRCWIGNIMGIWIFTPILLIFLGHPRDLWKKRRNYICYPLIMLLAFVVVIFYYSEYQEKKRIEDAFNHQTQFLDTAFRDELNSHIKVNHILKSFFENSKNFSKQTFQNFAQTLLSQHSSLHALEWIPYVPLNERQEFELSQKIKILELDKNADKTKKEGYFPIQFIEPLEINKTALGYDISQTPLALKAILNARDTGRTTITEKLNLIQSPNEKDSLVIYSPIYTSDAPLTTVKERRAALLGFIANVVRIEKEIKEIQKHISQQYLFLKIEANSQLLYDSFPKYGINQSDIIDLKKQIQIRFANQLWKFTYAPTNDFFNLYRSWDRWWLLFGCLLFTGLTGTALLMLTGRTLRTEEQVKVKTQALHKQILEREGRNHIFHAIAGSKSLKEVLELIVSQIEAERPELCCTILLLDSEEKSLKYGASGRLPKFYLDAIDGIKIGEGVGSCGTAAYLEQRIIVEDVFNHPYWENYHDLAKQAGFVASWSEPIFSSEHKLLGTFGIYYSSIKSPTKRDLEKIDEFAQLTSLAIERKSSEEKIAYLAFYDSLTKLPNRRLLYDRLHRELITAERYNNHGALMFLDLDHFKTLNDSLGHQVGDDLLVQVAQRLRECVRDEDTIARLGGDEFVVLLKTSDTHGTVEQVKNYALIIAERIQSALYIPYSLHGGYEHVVTSSIGITLFGRENKDIEVLFKQADTAMYVAKSKGRNAFSFYNEDMAQQADERLLLEQDIRLALERKQFELYYQAQHNADKEVISAEALLRWRHPIRGLLTPDEFMPFCEESGLILALGEWIFKEAAEQLIKSTTLSHISVNVSARQFYQPQFAQQIKNVFTQYKLEPKSLMLELTEDVFVKDIATSIERLKALHEIGVKIAIDNFGSGSSSLPYLKHLPIDQLKIDRKFVHNINNSHDDKLIIEAMLMIAEHLNLNLVAEGVEKSEQVKFLQEKHCHIYQGYFFSAPLAAEEFNQLLTQLSNKP